MSKDIKQNKGYQILDAAYKGHYGVPGVLAYNLETVVATVRAAEAKRSPAQILLFPWAITYANSLLVNLAADACRSASVPISLHLDHAQDENIIRRAATMPFDSIMVDMSHYEKAENLRKTTELTRFCHARGITVEAEPGRIEGGEAGLKDTKDAGLEGRLTDEAEVKEFVKTGIDFLAPAFGNLHGMYGGSKNINLDYGRLSTLRKSAHGKVLLVLHGTNEFTGPILRNCVKGGITRFNVNDLTVCTYNAYIKEKAGKVPLTELMENGTKIIQQRIEWVMDTIGSTGKARGPGVPRSLPLRASPSHSSQSSGNGDGSGRSRSGALEAVAEARGLI